MDKTILLVDDSPDDQMLVMRAVKKAGLRAQVIVASDGEEALAYLSKVADDHPSARLPCVILLDLKMPRLDGTETLRRIRADARIRHLPVVVFTSSNERVDVERCYSAGVSSFVRKPVDSSEFAETVRIIGQYWVGLNEPPAGSRPLLGARFSY